MRLPTEKDHLAHVVFPSKDCEGRLGCSKEGVQQMDERAGSETESHQTPSNWQRKGDGIRIPTTKGDESAKPDQRETQPLLRACYAKSRFPSTNDKSLR